MQAKLGGDVVLSIELEISFYLLVFNLIQMGGLICKCICLRVGSAVVFQICNLVIWLHIVFVSV